MNLYVIEDITATLQVILLTTYLNIVKRKYYIMANEYNIYTSNKQFNHTVTAYLVIFKLAKR